MKTKSQVSNEEGSVRVTETSAHLYFLGKMFVGIELSCVDD